MTRGEEISLTGVPHIGRATVLGMALGWLVVAFPVVVGMLAHGATIGEAVLFGSHVGFFAGMGFGGMIAAVLQANRFERVTAGIHTVSSDWQHGAGHDLVDHAA
jgi:hypothetical protein